MFAIADQSKTCAPRQTPMGQTQNDKPPQEAIQPTDNPPTQGYEAHIEQNGTHLSIENDPHYIHSLKSERSDT